MPFRIFLDELAAALREDAVSRGFPTSLSFEDGVRAKINELGGFQGRKVSVVPKPQVFPDISIGQFGIEIKHTLSDTWRSVANSISEGSRDENVAEIFVVFCKMGGVPDVKWAAYEDCVMHVRTSHVPRFELEIGTERPLFRQFGLTYAAFSALPMLEKMVHVRRYAKARLKPGERLWWLGDPMSEESSVPAQVLLFKNLEKGDKERMRAEATLLCPQVFDPGQAVRTKFDDALMYLLIRYGVQCGSGRDLFTAGSVSPGFDPALHGTHINRATSLIWDRIVEAAKYLSDELIEEYWGKYVPIEKRLEYWLREADRHAGAYPVSRVVVL